MVAVLFLACVVALIAGGVVAAALWHRRHPRAASDVTRRWWSRRGLAWSRPAYLTVHLLVGLAATVAMLLLFAQISDWVADQAAITRVDVQVDARLHAMATPFGLRVAKGLSLVGGPPAMAVLAIVGVAYLALVRRDRELLIGWVMAIGGGGLLDLVLKTAFHRPRPMFADPFAHGYGFSFPSGHSMGSVIGFGMLAYVIASRLHGDPAKATIAGLTAVLCAAIGLSRLYLGVHFPSDVLGGFAAGLMWLAACLSGLEVARERTGSSHTRRAPDRVSPLHRTGRRDAHVR